MNTLFLLNITTYRSADSSEFNASAVYGITLFVSLIILLGYCIFIKSKELWTIVLFSSVFVVNAGYFWLSRSTSLEMALHANRLAYLGSVFLPLSMFLSILRVIKISYKKWIPGALLMVSVIVFMVAASPGISDIYYQDVSLVIVDGVTSLQKVYGPWHSLYLLYLLGYFGMMIAVIFWAAKRNRLGSTLHGTILAMAVFVNIGVWGIEQLTNLNFEFLSISYIISEVFLLAVHLIASENKRLKDLIAERELVLAHSQTNEIVANMAKSHDHTLAITDEQRKLFLEGIQNLTPTEKIIYEAYISRITTKEILATLNITENTLKFHNKNIYGKLGVSSRKELLEIYKFINSK